jgi:hypothetical protein
MLIMDIGTIWRYAPSARKVMGRKNKFSKGTPLHATKKFAYQTFRKFIAPRRITASLTLLSLKLS